MTISSAPTITGVILAGGQGQRMGGQDKGLLTYRGKPLIEYILASLAPQVDQICINANRHQEIYQSYQYPVFADDMTGYCGPLAGILSAMRSSDSDYLLVVPCDSVQISPNLRQRLMESLLREQADIAVAYDGERIQPVFCLVARYLAEDLAKYLTQGDRKMDLWFKRHHYVKVDFSDQADSFINFNQPDDLSSYHQAVISPVPVLGFSAFSGTGKTTLLTQLIPLLIQRGLDVAVIKHAHHKFDIDVPGKDSYKMRQAGSQQTLVSSSRLMALMQTKDDDEPQLTDLISRIDHTTIDMILVEGFKHESFPKIELHRPSEKKPFLYPDDDNIIAIASDETLSLSRDITALDINQIETIADFIVDYIAH